MTFLEIIQKIEKWIQDENRRDDIKFWVNKVYYEICEMWDWYWLISNNRFITVPPYNEGTVYVVQGSNIVDGINTNFTTSMIGRILSVGDYQYKITNVLLTNRLEIDTEYIDNTGEFNYEIIKKKYDLPNDFRRMIGVLINERKITNITKEDYLERAGYDSGRPNEYYLENNKIIFNPGPDDKYIIDLQYYKIPAELVNDTDIPILPKQYHHLLVFGGYMKMSQFLDDITYKQFIEQEYYALLSQMKKKNDISNDMEFVLE